MSKNTKKSYKWIINKTNGIMYNKYNDNSDIKTNDQLVAAFDLDWTLIKPKSGHVHPKNYEDWEILYPDIIKRLIHLKDKKDYTIIIITNYGTPSKKITIKEIQKKFDNIIKLLGIKIRLYSSIEKKSKKPRTIMYDFMMKKLNFKDINKKSFYVGDAAGRIKDGKLKKDFAASDRKFAYNVGLSFYTPEKIFLEKMFYKERKWDWGKGVNPDDYKLQLQHTKAESNKIYKKMVRELISKDVGIIVSVGYPGIGKSTFYNNYLSKRFEHINTDILKTKAKTIKKAEEYLKQGKPIVIDNTNLTRDIRKVYIDMGKKYNIKLICIYFEGDIEYAKHLSTVRTILDKNAKPIPDVVYYSMRKKFQKPSLEEGFEKVITINYFPILTKKAKKIFSLRL